MSWRRTQVKDSPNLGSRVKKESCIDEGTEGTFKKHTVGVRFIEFTTDDKAFVRALLRQTQFILPAVDQSWWCGVQVKANTDGEGRWKDRSRIVHGR